MQPLTLHPCYLPQGSLQPPNQSLIPWHSYARVLYLFANPILLAIQALPFLQHHPYQAPPQPSSQLLTPWHSDAAVRYLFANPQPIPVPKHHPHRALPNPPNPWSSPTCSYAAIHWLLFHPLPFLLQYPLPGLPRHPTTLPILQYSCGAIPHLLTHLLNLAKPLPLFRWNPRLRATLLRYLGYLHPLAPSYHCNSQAQHYFSSPFHPAHAAGPHSHQFTHLTLYFLSHPPLEFPQVYPLRPRPLTPASLHQLHSSRPIPTSLPVLPTTQAAHPLPSHHPDKAPLLSLPAHPSLPAPTHSLPQHYALLPPNPYFVA